MNAVCCVWVSGSLVCLNPQINIKMKPRPLCTSPALRTVTDRWTHQSEAPSQTWQAWSQPPAAWRRWATAELWFLTEKNPQETIIYSNLNTPNSLMHLKSVLIVHELNCFIILNSLQVSYLNTTVHVQMFIAIIYYKVITMTMYSTSIIHILLYKYNKYVHKLKTILYCF